jgi:glycerol-3-phosphate acyltransferase PlsX
MEEHAVQAVRRKERASIVVALEEVRDGRAGAAVSAGNSGAMVAAAIFVLGRPTGIERPGIAIPLPTLSGRPVYLIDAGAFVDPRPSHLVSLARLISDFVATTQGISAPRIGLLSNGEEPGKGNALVREAYELLSTADDLNFGGNVEANEFPNGPVDAVVCDGFSGNVLLKTAEGTAALFQQVLRTELTSNLLTKLLAAGLRPAFRRAGRALDYREYGGAPLLGVKGVVFIAHGRSDARAIESALVAAANAARSREERARHRNAAPELNSGTLGADSAGRVDDGREGPPPADDIAR